MNHPAPEASRRRRRTILLVAAAVTSVLLVLLALLRGDRLRALLGAKPRPAPLALRLVHPPDPKALGRIDYARVHRTLWPDWVRLRQSAGADSARAKAALAALRSALHGERNLTELLDEIARRARRDLRAEAARVLYLCWAWGAYLQKHGHPWRVVGGVRRGKTPRADLLYVKTYHVLYRAPPPLRLALLRRADRLDLGVDPVVRASVAEGAFVEVDGLETLAVTTLWPLLDARGDAELTAAERAFAQLLRPLVARALPPRALAALRDSVGDRLVLRQTARAINARARCGSRFRLSALPWWGLATADEGAIRDAVARSAGHAGCPEVTKDEQRALLAASDRLARRAGLADAVGALVGWLARGAARQALALLAARRADARCRAGACPGLGASAGPVAHARLAATLAALADPEAGPPLLLRLCAADPGTTVRSAADTARQLALAALGDAPCSAPPADLARRARAARAARFSAATPAAAAALPSAAPPTLPRRLPPTPPPK